MNHRTRIKICGLSTEQEVEAAVSAGADAIGLVFYAPSPRYVSPQQAQRLVRSLPPYVGAVGLFVNSSEQEVATVVSQVPLASLQFHGDESMEQCVRIAEGVNRPFTRSLAIRPGMSHGDLLKCEQEYRAASGLFAGLLLDAFVEGYGGGGKVFDWSLIPTELAPRVILSGGLNVQNAAEAVLRVQPYALDVSSGVERSKGVKDPAKIHAFIHAVRQADLARADAAG